jgi:hypothetical protein
MDLIDLYRHIKSVNYSLDDSLNDIYNNIDDHTNQLSTIYDNAQIDAKDATVKSYTDNTFQPLSAKDNTIPMTPDEDHYPTTFAIKSYVDNLINQSSSYRGLLQWVSNDQTGHGDPAPTGANEDDILFNINTNERYQVGSDGILYATHDQIEEGNGYYYDVAHFTWNHNQSGTIKYNGNSWDYTITNTSQADSITIEVNASNNFQLKDGGITTDKLADAAITSTKINEEFLAKIENVQPDWNQTTTTANDFIKNKPTIPVIPGVATTSANGLMSYADKNKLTALPLQFYSMVPSYADKETVNRITANNGTWTATASGYVVCHVVTTQTVVAASGAITQSNIAVSVNDVVVDSSGGHSVVATNSGFGIYRTATIPVAKGDWIKIVISGTNITPSEITCFFIPPKFITYNYYGDEI